MNIKFRLSEKQEFDLVTIVQKYLARILKSQTKIPHLISYVGYKKA